mgnify:CR=1 FL=1
MKLDADGLRLAEVVFDELVELEPSQRPAHLEQRCGHLSEVRDLVERLLRHHDDGVGDFLREPPVPPAESLPGRVGPYSVLRKIGEGGMGVVFEARQEHPQRVVALKIIRPGFASPSMLRRFRQEADVLGQLQHPGIAHIYDAGTAEVELPGGGRTVQPFFAMEYVRGRPLSEYAESHRLDLRQRLELVARIADAVHHAHQKGVIHRDLKPANILVVADAPEPASAAAASRRSQGSSAAGFALPGDLRAWPKILDFGVARLTESETHTMTRQTAVGQLVGTVPYMSPEQVAGDTRDIDIRSDVYALGVILFELLARRLPYDLRERSLADAARVIRDEEPTRLSASDRRLRGDVETIVSKALEKDRDRRYASAAEFAADIRRYLRDEPIVARPASAFYQLRKFARRNRALVGGAAATLVVLAMGVVVASTLAIRESRQRALAERRFDEVRGLAKKLIFDIHDSVAKLPGSIAAREMIVQTGLGYVDGLSADADRDSPLILELAEAYRRLGNIQGNPHQSNLGHTESAITTIEKGRKLLEERLARDDGDDRARSLMIEALDDLGSLELARGRSDEAIQLFSQSLQLAERRLREHPENPTCAEDVATASANMGRLYEQAGRLEEAIAAMRRYRDWAAARVEAGTGEARLASNIGVIDARVARMMSALGRKDEAIELLRSALATAERRAAEGPGDVGAQLRVATTLIDLGHVLESAGRDDEALRNYQAALTIETPLADADPNDSRLQRNRAVAHFSVGLAMKKLHRHEEALQHMQQYRDRIAALTERDAAYVVLRRDLAIAHDHVGRILAGLRRYDEAVDAYGKARELYARLAEATPNDPIIDADMINLMSAIGGLHAQIAQDEATPEDRRVEHWRQSRAAYVEATEHGRSLDGRGVLTSDARQGADKAAVMIQRIDDELRRIGENPAESGATITHR